MYDARCEDETEFLEKLNIADDPVTISMTDMWRNLINLGVYDNYLHSLLKSYPEDTQVRVVQKCKREEVIEPIDITDGMDASGPAGIERPSTELKTAGDNATIIRQMMNEKLEERRRLIEEIADLQQKLDKSCWRVAEPERGIQNAEEDLFS
ncbi:hypothetical protein QQS21_007084 [Conoideocrella luteorostrata]|uniref:Uncharacterized protein n=1 Tax=Conoideocrella luteorostrata TaxID=1105319 RepID=A0AAJ0CLI1_9HYPO|nr:hypothetical protein QQS21_007084 [Conoideocrella luteorostrata]